jgi:cytochrome c oxidase assembly protein subunit 11
MTTPEQKKSNLRLALILASVALVFFRGLHGQDDFPGPLRGGFPTPGSTGTTAMRLKRENFNMMGKLGVIVLGMFAFGYALVPIYKAICEMTGINVLALSDRQIPGATSSQPANTQVDLTRTITVEFDANSRGPWHFKPARNTLQVHPGELTTVMYEFQNVQNRTMSAQAIPSYAPAQAGAHFNKLECFCFSQYTWRPVRKSSGRWCS